MYKNQKMTKWNRLSKNYVQPTLSEKINCTNRYKAEKVFSFFSTQWCKKW